ncbi:MAG: 5'-nucleotidase C-terminal domain-containing protein [Armatimonadetes bacterium]|nr:5'-nucleotidase C-terminal domain-containing protein [Armatimonadota bacterium]
MRKLAFAGAFLSLGACLAVAKPISITFVHSNDLHAHIEPTIIRKKAYGGYARMMTAIKQVKEKEKNVVLLNAGDTFQGTLYFNVYEGLADVAMLNAMGYQAMTLGNHEFDRGPAPLSVFAQNAQFPVLSSNIDFSGEPLLKDLVKPSTVLTVDGEKIGVVGCTVEDTPNISNPGPTLKFFMARDRVQAEVDRLTRQGINKIIVLSHIGYGEDKDLAKQLRDVDLIIGGHTHTPLGTPDLDGWPKAGGAYPTIVRNPQNVDVPVVQSWEWGKVLGKIRLEFDAAGRVRRIAEAKAMVLDESIPEDPSLKAMVAGYKKPLEAMQNAPIGEAGAAMERGSNAKVTSPMGCFISDAMLDATSAMGAQVALMNHGGVRSALEPGKITYGIAISVQPFNNTLHLIDLTGKELMTAFEQAVAKGGLIPSRGVKIEMREGKVVSATLNGEAIDPSKTYRVCVPSFLAGGGDGVFALRDAKGRRVDTGLMDIDVLVEQIKKKSPIKPANELRVKN